MVNNMKIKEVEVNYIDYGKKEGQPLVLLHGWGQNIAMMQGLGNAFQSTNRIIIVDLPGYGASREPTYPWEVSDYVECIHELLVALKVKKPIFIGHSFGGKISLLYASLHEVDKLVCLASPYRVKNPNMSLKTKVLKTAKKIPVLNKLEGFAKKHIGSTDYKNASDMMRKILVNTVNQDISNEVTKITCPTLLIWGTLDEAVPYEDAQKLETMISNCGLVTYEGCTHYAYLERFSQTVSVIQTFIGG